MIRNRHGERLDATMVEGAPGQRTLVVLGHGVTSHKERPWLVALADRLAVAGIASLRFSFAGNGASEGSYLDATISKAVEDLGSVFDAFADRTLVYAGHSMGAAVGVLRAARDSRLRALVSLAGMVHVQAFCERHFAGLEPGRDVMFGKAQCPLGPAFLADARAHGSVLAAAARVRVPWLLAHGTADELVPLQDALEARAAAGGRPVLVELAGFDHRFSQGYDLAAAAVVDWLVGVLPEL